MKPTKPISDLIRDLRTIKLLTVRKRLKKLSETDHTIYNAIVKLFEF